MVHNWKYVSNEYGTLDRMVQFSLSRALLLALGNKRWRYISVVMSMFDMSIASTYFSIFRILLKHT